MRVAQRLLLRQAQKTAPTAVLQTPAEMGLRLVGSMLEAGRSVAILINEQGNVVLGEEGDSIETPAGIAQIKKVAVEQITVLPDDEPHTLRMP